MKKDFSLFFILTTLAFLSRMISHQWNLTAVGAAALVAGMFISRKPLAFLVPVLALFLSDLVIGFHSTMAAVYLGYSAMVAISILRPTVKGSSFLINAFLGSAAFFIISNLGVYLEGVLYPKTFEGFIQCYLMALPFFKVELLSNLIGGFVLFKLCSLNRNLLAIKS